MNIADVIKSKGAEVVTLRPDATVSELLAALAEHNIGAVVVSEDGAAVAGIVSERDVVRHLGRAGAGVLDGPVSAIMTSTVHTCVPGDDVEALAGAMTEHRIRHVPVVEDGRLVAIVTIGDVVKHRIDQLQDERDHLVGYLHQ